MKKYLILFIAAISMSAFVGCNSDDEFTPPNYVTFEAEELTFEVDQNSSASYDVTVYTMTESGSARTFAINVAEESSISEADFSVPATVTVPANSNEGTFTVEITENTIADAGETLILTLGEEEGLYIGEPLEIMVMKLCEFTSLASSYTATVSAFGGFEAPSFEMVLTDEGDMVFSADSLWGNDFVAWATGDPAYSGLYVYSGNITLNSDNTLTVTSGDDFMTGGNGMYNPCTGTFSYTISTTLFGGVENMEVVLTPNE
jgi:hypothetical protein